NNDVAVPFRVLNARRAPDGDIIDASRVASERGSTYSHVTATIGIIPQGFKTNRCIKSTVDVAEKRSCADDRVVRPGRVTKECKGSSSCVLAPRGVAQKRSGACRRIVECCIGEKRSGANGRIETAVCIASERKETNCSIESTGGEIQQRALPFGRVAT